MENRHIRQQQMDNQVILKRKHKKPGKAKPHDIQQLGRFDIAHDIKKAMVFFKELYPVEQA